VGQENQPIVGPGTDGGPIFGEPNKNTKLPLFYAFVQKIQEKNAPSPQLCEITIRNIEISIGEDEKGERNAYFSVGGIWFWV
jgi:hypothetical protein